MIEIDFKLKKCIEIVKWNEYQVLVEFDQLLIQSESIQIDWKMHLKDKKNH